MESSTLAPFPDPRRQLEHKLAIIAATAAAIEMPLISIFAMEPPRLDEGQPHPKLTARASSIVEFRGAGHNWMSRLSDVVHNGFRLVTQLAHRTLSLCPVRARDQSVKMFVAKPRSDTMTTK